MIGGFIGGSSTAGNEAWSWHGTYWSPRAISFPTYPPRADAMLTFHPYLGAVLLGGVGAGGATLSDTYNWTGYG
jgi:hypothetical protein